MVTVQEATNMVTRGGGNGSPSYKKVVVDRGKVSCDVGFKEPLTGTLESRNENNQDLNQGKSDCVGEEARETQNNTP
jgi:hypothetical protein